MSDWKLKSNNYKSNVDSKRLSVLERVSQGSLDLNDAYSMLFKKKVNNKRIPNEPYCKVTDHGLVAIYGFTPRPLVLFEDRCLNLLDYMPEVRKFVEENTDKLKKPMKYNVEEVTTQDDE